MRYSGLTGTAISTMLINNYLSDVDTRDISSTKRILDVSRETAWCNDEVITRSTGANNGEDGFLRPGVKYEELVEYLYHRAKEMQDTGDSTEQQFRHSWLKKFGSSLIPRKMESIGSHTRHLEQYLCSLILKQITTETEVDALLTEETSFIENIIMYANDFKTGEGYDGNLMSGIESQWRDHVDMLSGEYKSSTRRVINNYMHRAYVIVDVIRRSYKISLDEHREGQRISSEAENELKPIDALIYDTSFEAQVFANGLAISALLATASLALTFSENTTGVAMTLAVVLPIINTASAFGTMTNVARYQNRLEEFRTEYFYGEKIASLENICFSLCLRKDATQLNRIKIP